MKSSSGVMKRITVSLNEDVYLFVQKSYESNPEYRNASHFVESCIRLLMENSKLK